MSYLGNKSQVALYDSYKKEQADATFAPITRSRKNLLINGNFAINQREYVSGTATTSVNQYTLDRFRVVVSGESLTFTASGNGNEVTAPAGGLEQVVEGANIAGGTYTLSWQGTATATVNGTSVANGGQVTLTANTNAVVRFSGGTVSRCQLEQGDTATDFEHRSLVEEMQLCLRYYEINRAEFRFDFSNNGSLFLSIPFRVEKRTTPATFKISEPTGINVLGTAINPNNPLTVTYDLKPSGAASVHSVVVYGADAEL